MLLFNRYILIGIMMCCAILSVSTSAFAVHNKMEQPLVLKELQLMRGDWYTDNGTKVLSINDKYINGCEVLSVYDFAGGSNFASGIFRIQESTGIRDLKIHWKIFGERGDYITLNDTQMLHKTQNYFYESVSGIHLGMSADNVMHQLGHPGCSLSQSSPIRIGESSYTSGWYYPDKN